MTSTWRKHDVAVFETSFQGTVWQPGYRVHGLCDSLCPLSGIFSRCPYNGCHNYIIVRLPTLDITLSEDKFFTIDITADMFYSNQWIRSFRLIRLARSEISPTKYSSMLSNWSTYSPKTLLWWRNDSRGCGKITELDRLPQFHLVTRLNIPVQPTNLVATVFQLSMSNPSNETPNLI